MRLVNMTPHPIRLIDDSDGVEKELFFPSDGIIRVYEKKAAPICVQDDRDKDVLILLYDKEYEDIELPPLRFNTIYIVSSFVKEAIKKQKPEYDQMFIVPTDMVKDTSGEVIGCRGFRL